MNLDLSKASGSDCITLVVLKNCEPELSYILAEPVNKCLIKEPCFSDCWKVSSVIPVFKNAGESSATKNYCPVSLLYVVSKVFEKFVNKKIDHLVKCGLFSDFQYGSRSSWSTADLFTVVSDRILGLLTGLGLLELSGHMKLNNTNTALLLQELTQKYWKLTDYWTKSCYLSLPFYVYYGLRLIRLPSSREIYSFREI